MKFIWERENPFGCCVLQAVPGEYDAVPRIDSLILEAVPRLVSKERLAAASALAFSQSASGELVFDYKVSAEMAMAMEELVAPARIAISPISLEPKAFPTGPNVFALNINSAHECGPTWHGFDAPRVFELDFTPIDKSYSSSFTADRLSVPTNAGALYGRAARAGLLPFVAAAVLLAEDYDVGTIRLPEGSSCTDQFRQVSNLLQTCGLRLEVPQ